MRCSALKPRAESATGPLEPSAKFTIALSELRLGKQPSNADLADTSNTKKLQELAQNRSVQHVTMASLSSAARDSEPTLLLDR